MLIGIRWYLDQRATAAEEAKAAFQTLIGIRWYLDCCLVYPLFSRFFAIFLLFSRSFEALARTSRVDPKKRVFHGSETRFLKSRESYMARYLSFSLVFSVSACETTFFTNEQFRTFGS